MSPKLIKLIGCSIFTFTVVLSVKTCNYFNTKNFEQCEEYNGLPVIMKDVKLVLSNRVILINGDVEVSRNIPGPLQMVLAFNRCISEENPDTCEKYHTLKFPNCCPLFVGRNVSWISMVRDADPPLRCPLTKGHHVFRNSSLGKNFNLFPMRNFLYPIKLSIFVNRFKTPIFCIKFVGRMVYRVPESIIKK